MPELSKLNSVTFICTCGQRFERAPERVEDFLEDPAHPWAYFATCRNCGDEAKQAHWERNLMRAHANATGPKTPEGKAKSAANLIGHPTPEETTRTRFNAMKHGVYARTATYFPAKPGRYPHCESCQFLSSCDVGSPCQKRTELFLRHHVAVESGDPRLLSELNSDIQASVHAIMQDMLIAIIGTGVEIRQPTWYYDKDGGLHFVKYKDDKGNEHQIYEINQHPLLKPLMEFMSKNGMTLSDMNLTARQQDVGEESLGHLGKQKENAEQAMDYQRRNVEAMERMAELAERGRKRLESDPILIEHDTQ